MRFAIDRYYLGKEKEVKADDFDSQLYIPNRRERFRCPECGEIVYFRAKGGAHPNQFFHQEKTDRTPECDKRVDGRSELSLSERVGLPLYITSLSNGVFQLGVGFSPLGHDLLQKAIDANYSVEISCWENNRKYRIDYAHFFEKDLTILPIDFIPKNGKNYTISISGDKFIHSIQRKWSNYCDGFEYGGAIFSYDETGGKKIRRGDSISTYRDYYAVMKRNFKDFDCIEVFDEGQLDISSETYKVYRFKINVSIEDRLSFIKVENYIRSYFGIGLLECQPELIPLWPPVVDRDAQIPIVENERTLCLVSSGNNNPDVYAYSDRGVLKVAVKSLENEVKVIGLTIKENPITLSVDRKYVGRETTFQKKAIVRKSFTYDFGVKDSEGVIKPVEELTKEDLSSDHSFISKGKVELYYGNVNKKIKHFCIRENETNIPKQKDISDIYIVVESGIYIKLNYFHELLLDKNGIDDSVFDILASSNKGECVPIPRWASKLLLELGERDSRIKNLLTNRVLSQGKVSIELLKKLKTIQQNA